MESASGSGLSELLNKRVDQTVAALRQQLQSAKQALTAAESSLNTIKLEPAEVEAAIGPPPASASATPGSGDFRQLRDSVNAIEAGASQVTILNTLMEQAALYAARVSLFIARGDSFSCWAASGFTRTGGITDEQAKTVALPTRLNTVLRVAGEAQTSYLGGSSAHADNDQLFAKLGSIDPVELCAIPIQNKGRVAAVFYADSGNSGEGIASPESLEVLVKVAGMAVELLPLRQQRPAAPQQAAPQQAAPQQAAPQQAAPQQAAPQQHHAPAAAQPSPAAARPQPTPAAAPTPAPTPAATTPAASGQALSPEDQKLHDAAKRFARLLVSEIKLYNETKVVEGRKNRDIYQRLKDDIDRSRQMYGQRVSPKVASTTTYFFDELVNTLAEGDAQAMTGYRE